jgi:hypothetical protein
MTNSVAFPPDIHIYVRFVYSLYILKMQSACQYFFNLGKHDISLHWLHLINSL